MPLYSQLYNTLQNQKFIPGLVVASCKQLVFTSSVVAARVPHQHLEHHHYHHGDNWDDNEKDDDDNDNEKDGTLPLLPMPAPRTDSA